MYHLWLIDVGRNQHYTQSNYPPIEINKFLKIKVKKKDKMPKHLTKCTELNKSMSIL